MNLAEIVNPQNNVLLMASAGTGKTFNLALRAVAILLQNSASDIKFFDSEGLNEADTMRLETARSIVCLTFTRKATAEMNSRIRKFLRGLVLFGYGTLDEEHREEIAGVYNIISESLGGISPQETASRAKAAEDRIFRHPNTLRIQTIDSFLGGILRLFPFEAGVRPDYSIAQNSLYEQMRSAAFAEGFASRSRHEDYTSFFDRYIALFEKHKSFGFISRLEEFVGDLCKNIKEYADIFKNRYSDERVRGMLEEAESIEKALLIAARELFEFINIDSPKKKDVRRYGHITRLKKFLEGHSETEDTLDALYKLEPCEIFKIYPFRNEEGYLQRWQRLKELMAVRAELKSALYLEFAKQLTGTVYDRLEAQKSRRTLFSYSDILHKVFDLFHRDEYPLDGQHLYFRLDGRISHLLIDEFQDTSYLQWKVLAPMAEEAMAGVGFGDKLGSFFCVGDQKQSLYRFRGAIPGFMGLVEAAYAGKLKREDLDKNHRSDKEIVAFANELFKGADTFIEGGERLKFDYIPQTAHSEAEGLVAYTVCDRKNRLELMLDAVYELLSRNFAPKDIAILTHTWNKGWEAREYLESRGIPAAIFNEETLSQKASYSIIKGLVTHMYYGDDFSLYQFLYTSPALGESSDLFFSRAKKILAAQLAKSAGYPVYKRIITLKGRYNIVDRLSPKSAEELAVLMDIIAQKLSDIINPLEFLEKFEILAEDTKLSADEAPSYMMGSVSICTINHAKGLEFPAVILFDMNQKTTPRSDYFTHSNFADSSLSATEIYLRITHSIPEYIISQRYKDAFEEESRMVRFDEINKLYVAVTRAQHALYLFAEKTEGNMLDAYITGVFPESFRRGELADFGNAALSLPKTGREKSAGAQRILHFSKYILSRVKNPTELSSHPALAKFVHDRKEQEAAEDTVETETYAARDYGILLHSALFNLADFTEASVSAATAKAWQNFGGYMDAHDKTRLEQDILLLLADPQFQELIKERAIYREKALFYDNKLLVTDLFARGSLDINLIDFKTSPSEGEREADYINQVIIYKKALNSYYNLPVNGFIVYINEGAITLKGVEGDGL
jgi:ATP-dependent exoDNAse (exonuclease V) beta subunit